MNTGTITAVGIDVSKHKSTVAARRPGGEVVLLPFDVEHTAEGLKKLITKLRQLDGEIRIVMEHTGMYWRPIAMTLKEAGFYVSVVNAILIHNFSDNSIRKVKTDRADAMKIANYGLTFWSDLQEYAGEDENRQLLKIQSRLYERTATTAGMLRNGLISLLDQTFPGANKLFRDDSRNSKGHVKWIDFVLRFWHKECVAALSLAAFTDTFQKWCKRTGYKFSASDAERIHAIARNAVATLPKNDSTKLLITQATNSLNAIYDSLQAIRTEMDRLASMLPEYELVMGMEGIGKVTGPQLMAEVGDVRRFSHKGALVDSVGGITRTRPVSRLPAPGCVFLLEGHKARLRRQALPDTDRRPTGSEIFERARRLRAMTAACRRALCPPSGDGYAMGRRARSKTGPGYAAHAMQALTLLHTSQEASIRKAVMCPNAGLHILEECCL